MLERFATQEDLYHYKLGAALTMERTVLQLLDDKAEHTADPELEQLYRAHLEETREHMANIERAFAAFGWEVDVSPCPAMEALQKEVERDLEMAAQDVAETVMLMSAASIEHYEIAVYGTLLAWARGLQRDDVADLFERNREQEQKALERLRVESERVLGSPLP
jgi:ferritin-like metal-binding protein YciE